MQMRRYPSPWGTKDPYECYWLVNLAIPCEKMLIKKHEWAKWANSRGAYRAVFDVIKLLYKLNVCR